MPLPGYLAEEVEALRTDVERVDGLSVQYLYKNSEAALTTIRNRIAGPEAIDAFLSDTLRSILNFAQVFQQNWQHGEAGKADIDRMRRAVIDNIDALETTLSTAEPSNKAGILGIG